MDEAAALLKVSLRTIYRLQDRGDLPLFYIGKYAAGDGTARGVHPNTRGRRRTTKSAIDAYIAASQEVVEVPAPKPRAKATLKR